MAACRPEPALANVLLTLALAAPWQQRLRELLQASGCRILEAGPGTPPDALLQQADIALLQGDPWPACASAARLRWLHCGHSGVDRHLPAAQFVPGRSITSAAGRSAPALAEHALFMLMQLAYADSELRWLRRWRQWRAPPPERRRALHGRTLGIIGMGHTGRCLADLGLALGLRVLGWRRQAAPFPASVAQGYSAAAGDRLPEMLAQCEFLVLACALNDGSRGLLGAAELAALPRGAILVNVARAALVDEAALLAALDAGHLGGAGLDVHYREPLPARSRWWSHPRVVMSPHRGPRLDSRDERHFRLIEDNLRLFLAGQPLHNLLGPADACTPAPAPTPADWRERLSRRLLDLGFRWARWRRAR